MSVSFTKHAVIKGERKDSWQREQLFVALESHQVGRPDVFQTKRISHSVLNPTQVASPHCDLVVQLNFLAFSMSIWRVDRPLSPMPQRQRHRVTRGTEVFIEHKTSLNLLLVPLVMTVIKDVVRTLILDVLWRTNLLVRNPGALLHRFRQHLSPREVLPEQVLVLIEAVMSPIALNHCPWARNRHTSHWVDITVTHLAECMAARSLLPSFLKMRTLLRQA